MLRLRRGTSGGIVPDAGVDPGLLFMKRKIAAIFAADIAGYSRLVAEDEEETLRRLASYRQGADDLIPQTRGGRFSHPGEAGRGGISRGGGDPGAPRPILGKPGPPATS